MERRQNISLEDLKKIKFITTPTGREGIAGADGSLDYTTHGQNYLQEQEPRERTAPQDIYIFNPDDSPLGY